MLFKSMSVIQCSNVFLHRESWRESGRKLPAAAGKNRREAAVTETSRSTTWIISNRAVIWTEVTRVSYMVGGEKG